VAWSLGGQPRSPEKYGESSRRSIPHSEHKICSASYQPTRNNLAILSRTRQMASSFLAVLAKRHVVHGPPISFSQGLRAQPSSAHRHLKLVMTKCSLFRNLRLCNPRLGEYCNRKLEHVCLACIRPFLVGDRMVSLNPFRSRSKFTSQTIRSLPNRCPCKRCNCPHAERLHSLRKYLTGTHYQVFCAACNDVCLAHSMKGSPGMAGM
jgi:hypothetical protein